MATNVSRPWRWPTLAALLAVVVAAALAGIDTLDGRWAGVLGVGRWSSQRKAESMALGDGLVAAVERYKADHGRYPGGLDELVPAYLTEVVPPTAGTRAWDYNCSADGTKFVLRFSVAGGYPKCYYQSGEFRAWGEDS
jgi:hypothetical protein